MFSQLIDAKTLPEDPEQLIKIIEQQQMEIESKDKEIDFKNHTIQSQKKNLKEKDYFIENLQIQLEAHIKASTLSH